MDDQYQKLQSQGFKITPQRKLILDIMRETTPLTGEEITKKAREKQPHISAGTIYRNLHTLCETGLVRITASTEGARHFESTSIHRHRLYCLSCNDTVEIDFCPMNEKIQKLAKLNGFEIADHHFQISGYCTNCRKGEKANGHA